MKLVYLFYYMYLRRLPLATVLGDHFSDQCGGYSGHSCIGGRDRNKENEAQ